MNTSPAHDCASFRATGVPVSRETPAVRRQRYATDLRIGPWLVQPSLNRLTRGEVNLRVRAQLMDLLLCLASRPGKVFAKEEIVADVWEGRWIAQSALSRCVAELRAAVGDDAQQPHVIQTITKRGYRLIAPVEVVAAAEPPLARAAAAFAAEDRGGSASDDTPPSCWRRLVISALPAPIDAPRTR
jgi:DNA-binding winged helix-turn-helix (wHTH) protein